MHAQRKPTAPRIRLYTRSAERRAMERYRQLIAIIQHGRRSNS